MLPLCADQGIIGVIPWSPLARGRLTRDPGTVTARSETDEFGKTLAAAAVDADRAVIGRVAEIAATRGVPQAQVALAWIASRPTVTTPIVGATRTEHLDDAVAALDIELTDDEVAQLEEPDEPHPVMGHR